MESAQQNQRGRLVDGIKWTHFFVQSQVGEVKSQVLLVPDIGRKGEFC